VGMHVELLHITPNAEEFIGSCAAICYDSDKTDAEKSIRRAKSCADKGHLATLRFASAVFNISGISRVCSHQFVRSKHLDFLQRSQRYCKEDDTQFVNFIPDEMGEFVKEVYEHQQSSLRLYKHLLKYGVKKEDARSVLPEATHTELNVVGNLQAWKDFIKLRADPHAQYEIRQCATLINNILHEQCPNLFNWMTPL